MFYNATDNKQSQIIALNSFSFNQVNKGLNSGKNKDEVFIIINDHNGIIYFPKRKLADNKGKNSNLSSESPDKDGNMKK